MGTYGSTTASGWTTIGLSDGSLPSGAHTNVIYVSDSLGSDNRDGSTPTFVDDNDTAQFVLSSAAHPVVNDVYVTPNGTHVTVAAVPRTGAGNYTFWQMKSRTGTPDLTGTLTRTSGSGPAGPLTYTAMTLGIHGPVKTIIKAASSAISAGGPGPYDLENTGGPFVPNGDGTGLGTIGNWRTAGSVAASFGLRGGFPDWVLLRMGDTFAGQPFETNYNGGSDNWGVGGASELEPMVLSAYDENFAVATHGANVGARARPIITVPSATPGYAAMQPPGDLHLWQARPGIEPVGGNHNYLAIIGIDFYAPQRNPSAMEYIGAFNVQDSIPAIHVPQGITGILIEDVHAHWFSGGVAVDVANFDVNIRRSQIDHCYGSRALGAAIDDVKSAGGVFVSGFSFEENVLDLCGYTDPNFSPSSGDNRSRNAYLQWDAIFGNRRGNTSTRSGSEDFQFRAGGLIDNNFTYIGSFGFDVGHSEGDPPLTSATTSVNNVVTYAGSPSPIALQAIGLNFYNSNNVSASNNLIAHINSSTTTPASTLYAATEAYDGGSSNLAFSSPGSGGVPGWYGCVGGPSSLVGGHGTQPSTYSILIDGTGKATTYLLVEPHTDTYAVGDVLTPPAGYPSINTAGTTLSNAGSGGAAGDYGTAFANPGCAPNVSDTTVQAVVGIPLTNFSGSMAGFGARAIFTVGGGGTVTSYTIVGTGQQYQVGDVLTASPADVGGLTGLRITVTAVAHLSGWAVTITSVTSQGVHGLSFTGNTVFDMGPAGLSDAGGTHDSPQPGGPGSGAANVFTPNTFCPTAQFTGVITGTNSLATSAQVTGSVAIAIGQNLAGPGVAANTTITGGSGSSWTVSPNQNVSSTTMYSYTCAPTTVFPHPENTVTTYAATLGLTATIDGYLYGNGTSTGAINNYKNLPWNPALTANNGLNPYIRHGFGMTP
jgi:hypothetical protein